MRIDPRGLTSLAEDSIEASGGFPADPQLNLSMQSFQDELRLSQMSLRSLSEDTGGYAAVNSNDFTKAWDRVVADNSSYYVLGYYPKNERRDGRFRKLDVKVRREGLEVRTRKGYTAPRGKAPATTTQSPNEKTSPDLRRALDSPLPLPALTLRGFAAPFRGAAPNASVAVNVEAEGADLAFQQKEGKFVDDLEVSVIALDSAAKLRDGTRDVVNMGLKPETRARVAQTGIRMQSRLKLPPGRYQLRMAARETGSGRVGSITYDLEVPDFSKEPISMSGIVIGSVEGQSVMTAKTDEELRTVLPLAPTASREFRAGDGLATFVEVYDNQPQPPHKVDIATSILTDEGRVVFNTSEERNSTELQGKSGGYGVTTKIPLTGFAPGLYVLKVEAQSHAGEARDREAGGSVQSQVKRDPSNAGCRMPDAGMEADVSHVRHPSFCIRHPLHLPVPVFRLGVHRAEDLQVPLAAAPGFDDLGCDNVHEDLCEAAPFRVAVEMVGGVIPAERREQDQRQEQVEAVVHHQELTAGPLDGGVVDQVFLGRVRADIALERELAGDDLLDRDLLVPAIPAVFFLAARLGDVFRAAQGAAYFSAILRGIYTDCSAPVP